jgi:hypothetical protein
MTEPEPPDVPRLRAALLSLADRPGWPAADAERVFSALHGDVPAEERRQVIDELIRNPEAAAVWRLARELAPETPLPARPARTWRKASPWFSAAAAVLLAAGLGLWLVDRPVPPVPTYRAGAGPNIASLLPPDVPLPRARPVLRWTAVPGATYRVRVLTGELELLEDVEDLKEPEHRVHADVLARLPVGAEILWQVEARVPGRPPVASPTFVVSLD